MTTEDIRWLDARDARSFIHERRPGLAYRAKGWLHDCLIAGDLTAKARKAITLADHRSLEVERDDWIMPARVWKGSPRNSHFDIEAGSFRTQAGATGFFRLTCRGIAFNERELSDLLGTNPQLRTVHRRWTHRVDEAVRRLNVRCAKARAPGAGNPLVALISASGEALDELVSTDWKELVESHPEERDLLAAHAELSRLAGAGYGAIVTFAYAREGKDTAAFDEALEQAGRLKDRVNLLLDDALAMNTAEGKATGAEKHLDGQQFVVSPLLPHHVGKPIAMRKNYIDEMAKLIFNRQAKSRNDAAVRVARGSDYIASGCANEDALIKRLNEDYPTYYDIAGNPLFR